MQKYFVLCCFLLAATYSNGQGCSDAGVCSIDGYAPSILDSAKESSSAIRMGANYGRADHAIRAIGGYINYSNQLSEKWDVSAKLTMLSQADSSVSAFGISDLFLSTNYHFASAFSLNLGLKLPLSDAGKTQNDLPLPMDFQSSLGSIDLLLGVRYQYKFIQLMAGYQQPLTQNNNAFLSDLYPDGHQFATYQSTNKFQRSADAIFRAAFVLGLGKKLHFTPSALFIYHLSEDRFTDIDGIEKNIKGSDGTTINLNLALDYEVGESSSLQFLIASPLLVRETRPDGLTRSLVINLEYAFRF